MKNLVLKLINVVAFLAAMTLTSQARMVATRDQGTIVCTNLSSAQIAFELLKSSINLGAMPDDCWQMGPWTPAVVISSIDSFTLIAVNTGGWKRGWVHDSKIYGYYPERR